MIQEKKLANPEDCGEGLMPVMMCTDICPRFSDYHVATTHHQIVDLVEVAKRCSNAELRRTFVSSLRCLTQWSNEELHNHWKTQSQQWGEFCNDVAIFYTTRLVLMEKPIPISLYSKQEIDAGMRVRQ